MASNWFSAIPLDELQEGTGKLVRIEEKRIALFRAGDSVFATDNQCPHEGYPLADGTVQDGILTCNWHNWKFELEGGACTFGGEDVRTYPTEVRDGTVFVDVEDPPLDVIVPKRRDSLQAALEEMDTSRIARDVVRLLQMNTSPTEILLDAASFGAERAEYGWNHALAVLADCGRMTASRQGLDRTLPITQACRAVSEENLRLPPRPHAGPLSIERYASLDEAFVALRDAVETGRLEEAESLFRGALEARVPREDLTRWLYTLATDHFLSFGHALIYATKAFEMLDLLGERVLTDVFPCLIPEIHYATREDLLPYMRDTMNSLGEIAPELPGQVEKQGSTHGSFDAAEFRRAVLDGSRRDTFAATRLALDAGVPVDRILDAVVLAASERLLRFDPEKDWRPDADYNWLHVTHNLTYANAVRKAFRAVPNADVLRAVYFAAWFVNRTKRVDQPEETRWTTDRRAEDLPPATENDVRRAVADHDLVGAIDSADGLVRTGGGRRKLADLLTAMSLEDRASAQIFVDHLIKTAMAAIEESQGLANHPDADLPLLATSRFFAADRRERGVERQVRLAIDFVVHGKPSETV
jgi:nitrite reductase/ring-hydroxylating ferredoxin subunit